MNTNPKPVKTDLMHESARTLTAGIMFDHDHPHTQDELDRMNAANWLRKAAAELERLRGQRAVLLDLLGEAAHVIHNFPDEVETQAEADALRGLKDQISDARGAILMELAG